MRSGEFKYHIRRPISVGYAMAPIMLQAPMGPWLFGLSADPDESYDIIDRHPERAKRLATLLSNRLEAD